MKTKSIQPFVISDKNPKKQPFYYTLICGLQNNQLDLVQLALKNKVDVSKVKLPADPISADEDYDDKEPIEVLSAIDFARESCIPSIFHAIMESVKISPEQKNSIVLKSISEIKEGVDIATDKSLLDVLKKYVNAKNINQYHKIKCISHPTSLDRSWGYYENGQSTFLHVAVYTKNLSLINKLIELGADVNLKIKESSGDTVAHILLSNMRNKGDQSVYVNCLVALLNAGINLDLKNNEKQTGWEAILEKFKIPELRKIFANHQPTNLATIEMIRSKSRPLMEFWEKKTQGQGFTRYPLIDDVFKYEKRKIELTKDVAKVDKVEQFLKNKSLKKALEQRYGFSSSRLSSVITKNMFDRSQEHKVIVRPIILQIADWLKVLFTDNNTLNTSDFLEVLESYKSSVNNVALESINDDLNNSYRSDKKSIAEFKSLMNKCYTPQQKKFVLMNTAELSDSIDDTYDMYSKFSKELDIILKRTKFSDIDSLQKLHDLIVGEVETLEQADFPLDQDTVNPKLKALNKIKMNLGYGVKLAESNHELIRWGAQMGHCVGGGDYAEEAKKGETIILAITQENEAKYCIEISPRGEIRQVQGKSHTRPEPTVMEEFVKELKSKGILNKSQKASAWKQRD